MILFADDERESGAVACSSSNPAPIPNNAPSIHDLVIADIRARKELGKQRYGTILQAGNGRDALLDAYEEALDLAAYLRQAIAERDTPEVTP